MEKVLCSNVMGYTEFIEKIKKMSESVAGEDGSVQVTHVIKNNGCEYDGLVILKREALFHQPYILMVIMNSTAGESLLKVYMQELRSCIFLTRTE